MIYSSERYKECKSLVGNITILLNNINNKNNLLQCLSCLSGVGPTISSGLIYSMWRDKYVPFDKYTLEYAYRLNIIPDKNFETSYELYSNKVLEYINNSDSINSVEDFIRKACEY